MDELRGRCGPLNIQIKGVDKLFDRFCDEIISLDTNTDINELDLRLLIGDPNNEIEHFEPEYSSAKHHMGFNKSCFFYDQPVPFFCKNLFTEETCEIIIDNSFQFDIKSIIKSLLSVNINSRPEISYSLFWYIVQVLLLRKGYSFVHAGICSVGDQAIALMGTGGSGKTSILFQLLENSEYSYLSEDFGIVNCKGNSLFSSKTLSIYDSDIQSGSGVIRNTLKNLSFAERIRWVVNKVVFRKNPMKKIPVKDIFEEKKICEQANLKTAFYILRSNSNSPNLVRIKKDELSKRLVSVTLREMKKLVELLNLIKANAPVKYPYPSLNEFIKDTSEVYQKAFSDVDIYLLELPFKATPREVEQFLRSEKLIS